MTKLPAHVGEDVKDPVASYMRSLAAGSRRSQHGCLDRIASLVRGKKVSAEEMSWHLLRYEHTSRIREMLCAQGWTPAYVNKHLAALRRVLREAWLLRLMAAEDYQAAINIKAVTGSRVPRGRHIAAEEITAAIDTCASAGTHLEIRNAAVFGVFRYTGMRRAELGGMKRADYNREAMEIRVIGKGDRERKIPLNERAVELLEAWLAIRGDAPGALFIPIGGDFLSPSASRQRHLSGQAISNAIHKHLDATPHDFRRTLVGDLLDAGVDPKTIMDITGHQSITVMLSYDRRNGARAREALAQVA
ncbi:tyrosine-type recombinase/integrase [Streptosporangium sp. NPDC050855]|uniref:tyrosine-type recombinase/integrase n=1 Tax=Streptosporangium sp. NPDC050855 TaxID=3366194 RepID=UPI0037B460B7